MRKWIRRILLSLTLSLFCTVSVLADDKPEESKEDASESFWEYEVNQDWSALNVWAEEGEDIANFEYLNLVEDIESIKELIDILNGWKEMKDDYQPPVIDDRGLMVLDYATRIVNETPLVIFPPQMILTVAVDYLEYTEVHPDKTTATAEIIKATIDRAASLNPFISDFERRQHREKAHEHEIRGWAKMIEGVWKFWTWLSNKVPNGTNALKPNIYLYGPPGTEIDLTFAEEELLLTVLPDYKDQWTVQIAEDGSLTVDGEEGFPYLFYESATIPAIMQKEEGFTITPEGRWDQLAALMQAYGFNETETADFADYWDETLDKDQTFYVFPQETETVDLAMPLEVEGTPVESYYRIWFYFVPEDQAEEPHPAEIHPVEHNGTCLIEWGVVKE